MAKGKAVGEELFVSSGSRAGTRLLVDLNPGPLGSDLQLYGVRGGRLYFFRAVPGGKRASMELWVTDGTTSGTQRLRAGFSNFPTSMVGLGKAFYFFSWDSAKNRPVLFRTDGTSAGTLEVWDGNTRQGLVLVRNLGLMEWKGGLFFLAVFKDSRGVRLGLFSSDGSTKGTQLVLDFPKALGPATLPVLFPLGASFGIGLDEPGAQPFTLYVSKGTKASTRRAILPVAALAGPKPAEVASNGIRLFLSLRTQKEGVELWTVDGTTSGNKVMDLSPGAKSTRLTLGTPFLGGILFAARPEGKAQGLYWSDGKGTQWISKFAFAQGVKDVGVLGKKFFFANSSPGQGMELWISDGTPNGTGILADLEPGGRGANPRRFSTAMGKIFFASTTSGLGEDPWFSDGTPSGTQVLARLAPPPPGTGDANPLGLVPSAVGGTYYFRAEDPLRGAELWGTDGTPGGTRVLGDLEPGRWGSDPGEAIGLHGALLFAATRTGVGRELFASNGGPGGTGLLYDLNPGEGSGAPRGFVRVGDRVFFQAVTQTAGRELWVTDGSPGGTRMVWDLIPGPLGSNPSPIASFRGKLLFKTEPTKGVPGWFLGDGTSKGTVGLLDPKKALGVQKIGSSFILGNVLIAFVQDKSRGLELWRSMGGKGDAVPLMDLYPGSGSGVREGAFVFEERLYFLGRKGPGSFHLYRSDGTAKGTKALSSVNAPKNMIQFLVNLPSLEKGKLFGFRSSLGLGREVVDLFLIARGSGAIRPVGKFQILQKSAGNPFGQKFPQLGTRFAYFEAVDGNGLPRFFRTDGTSAGTIPLTFPRNLREVRVIGALPRGLLLAATDGFLGRELFLWDPGALSLPRGNGCDGVALQALDPVLGKKLLLGGRGKGGIGLLFAGFPLNPGFVIRADCRLHLNPFAPMPSLPFLVASGHFAIAV
ncbi:MAG TPA: hypothetical protein ENK02_14430, partial [Planctomycetes bacterium]|nr:hypothetical protein [Planctomycetota bacterium]